VRASVSTLVHKTMELSGGRKASTEDDTVPPVTYITTQKRPDGEGYVDEPQTHLQPGRAPFPDGSIARAKIIRMARVGGARRAR
jgi:hypothetical protein